MTLNCSATDCSTGVLSFEGVFNAMTIILLNEIGDLTSNPGRS